jgi:hypothetical protein
MKKKHEGASRFIEAGGTLIELMQQGGWRTLAQVQRYAHADDAHIRKVLNGHAAATAVNPGS